MQNSPNIPPIKISDKDIGATGQGFCYTDKLYTALENVQFCDLESGQYFRTVAVTMESTGPVVILERIE